MRYNGKRNPHLHVGDRVRYSEEGVRRTPGGMQDRQYVEGLRGTIEDVDGNYYAVRWDGFGRPTRVGVDTIEAANVRSNPVSSRTRAKHAALLAEHRYEDAAKVYKRAMGREKRKNPQYIEWSGMTGKDARGNVYKIQDKSRPGDPWFTVYLIPSASSWAGGVVEPMASRDSVRGAKDYAEQTAARVGAQQNPRRKKNPLTAGLGGTYIVTHANPRSAPSKSVKLRFSSRTEAWDAMHALDAAGIDAGFPSLGAEQTGPNKGYYTVQVARKNATAARKALSR